MAQDPAAGSSRFPNAEVARIVLALDEILVLHRRALAMR